MGTESDAYHALWVQLTENKFNTCPKMYDYKYNLKYSGL